MERRNRHVGVTSYEIYRNDPLLLEKPDHPPDTRCCATAYSYRCGRRRGEQPLAVQQPQLFTPGDADAESGLCRRGREEANPFTTSARTTSSPTAAGPDIESYLRSGQRHRRRSTLVAVYAFIPPWTAPPPTDAGAWTERGTRDQLSNRPSRTTRLRLQGALGRLGRIDVRRS